MMCVVTITFVMGVIGSFFEFGWAAFFASIFSIIATILGFILCAMFDDAFGTLNPYRIYIKLFWHKITFDGRTVLPETIEDWLTFNCTGRWKKGSRYLEYYLSKKEDAVHTKLVW